MAFQLSPEERKGLELLPDKDLADLAVELDIIPEAEIDRVALLEDAIPRLLALARREGLPFSKYDADDLEELPAMHRAALARAMGWPDEVRGMVKAGTRVYKVYSKNRRNSPIPVMVPILLKPLARHAFESPDR